MYKDISELKDRGFTDNEIMLELEDKYLKSKDDIDKIIKTWKSKYGYYGMIEKRINNYGINCDIKNKDAHSKLFVKGSNNVETITLVNKFVLTMVHIYNNLNKFKKNKKFVKYILTDKNINSLFDYEEEDEDENEEDGENMNKEESEQYENNINIDFDELDNIEIKDISDNSNEENEIIERIEKYKVPNEQVSAEAKLTCHDPIPTLSTCVDFCNDDSYFLRRLQQFDTRLFKFNITDKRYKRYSKGCQSSIEYKQPVVLQYNPDELSKIPNSLVDRDSYTYTYKYGSDEKHQYWYICPLVWCPYHQIPINYSKLKVFRSRATRKGKDCQVALCPIW